MTLSNCVFSNIEALYGTVHTDDTYGGVLYLETATVDTLDIIDVTASDFKSATHGGFAAFIKFEGTVNFDGTANGATFEDFTAATYGSFIYSEAAGITLDIDTITLKCDTTYDGTPAAWLTHIDTNLMVSNPADASRAGAIYVYDPADSGSYLVSVTSNDNSFSQCYVAQDGGIFTLVDVRDDNGSTAFTETSSTYSYNAAINGGSIKCDGCTAFITDAIFTTYHRAN